MALCTSLVVGDHTACASEQPRNAQSIFLAQKKRARRESDALSQKKNAGQNSGHTLEEESGGGPGAGAERGLVRARRLLEPNIGCCVCGRALFSRAGLLLGFKTRLSFR